MIIMPEDKNIISLLSPDDAQQVLLALFSEGDDLPDMSPLANMAYVAIKSKSERISAMKSKAGTKGGAPSGNQNAKKQAEQAEQAKTSRTTTGTKKQAKQPTVTDTVSVSVSVSDTVTDTVESTVDADAPPRTQKSRKFQKPTPEQVAEYCRERKNSVDAQRFIDYYEANGWRVGKNPMKDWMAAVRTWERSGVANQPRGQPQAVTTNPFVNLYRKEHGDESG